MSSQLQVTGEAKIRDIQGPVVANSGVITALDGAASQYVRGDGTLADFPTSSGGGSSVSYYLNSSVSQGTIGGVAYRELNKEPIIGAGTDIAISTTGYVASYITDANDPDVILIPGGNFNCEFYFSVNNNTGNPFFYAELYKYDGTSFTLLGSSVGVPEYINQGTVINPYYFAIPVATATLALTDRLAIRIYVNVDGRTITLHTENGHLCQVVTTLSKGMVSLNNLTDQSQFLTTGTSGTDFNIVSSGDTHTFNIPSASASNRGLITTGAQTIAGAKTFSSTTTFNTGGIFNNWGISLYDGAGSTALASTDLTGIFASKSGSLTDIIIRHYAPYYSKLRFSNDVADFTYTFPDLSGTLALLEAENKFTLVNSFDQSINYKTDAVLVGISGYISQAYAKSGSGSSSILSMKIADGNSVKNISLDFIGSPVSTPYSYLFPAFSGTMALLEGNQTFSGEKTFGTDITFNGYALMDIGVALAKTSGTPLYASTIGYANLQLVNSGSVNSLYLNDGDTLKYSKLSFNNAADYTYTFPAATGTIALTSNLSSYLPLAGGTLTGPLNGTNATFSGLVNAFSLSADGGTSNAGQISLKHTGAISVGSGYVTIAADSSTTLGIYFFNSFSAKFSISALTANRTYTLPDATGTIALLSGTQTFTGATTFSSDITVNGLTVGRGGGAFSFNTTVGIGALLANTTGGPNTAFGNNALYTNTTGNNNTGVGQAALYYNLSGGLNSAFGQGALGNQTTGSGNTGIGYNAGASITTGSFNIHIGHSAGGSGNTTGSFNTIIGSQITGLSTTLANNIILADGQGNIRYQWNGTNNVFGNPISGTSATFSSSVTSNANEGFIIAPSSGASYMNYKIGATSYSLIGIAGASNDIITGSATGDLNIRATNSQKILFSNNNGASASLTIASTGAATFSSSVRVGSASGGDSLVSTANSGTNPASFSFVNSGGTSYIGAESSTGGSLVTGSTGYDLILRGPSGITFSANNGASPNMRITSAGNVGIGTSSPANRLHVYNTAAADSMQIESTQAFATLAFRSSTNSSSVTVGIDGAGNAAFENKLTTGAMTFVTNGSERMRITSGGVVCVNSQSPSAAEKINITFDRTTNQGMCFNNTSSTAPSIASFIQFRYAGTVVGTIESNGTTTSYNVTSDYRLKQDLKDYKALDLVSAIKTYDYEWKLNKSRMYGVMAHELQEVLPYAVTGEKDAEEMQQVDYSKLVPILVKSIQELEARIKQLENK